MSETWEIAQAIRREHGLEKPGFDASIECLVNVSGLEEQWLRVHDPSYRGGQRTGTHLWKTAQLIDGRIVGGQGETVLAAQLSIEIWWGSQVVWIVPDGNAIVHNRYLGEVSTAQTRSREARTFPVTSGPIENPTRDGEPVAVQGEFDFSVL